MDGDLELFHVEQRENACKQNQVMVVTLGKGKVRREVSVVLLVGYRWITGLISIVSRETMPCDHYCKG